MSEASNDTRGRLIKLREELAKAAEDPSILEFDIDDPDTALGLVLTAAILKGGAVSLVAEDDTGRTETLKFTALGKDSGGQPVHSVEIGSSDGTLSPETANLAAEMLKPSFEAEVNRLTDTNQ